MFGMMTPIDAISYGLKAGMVFGQAQTIWATRLMEMQGFWMGFPAMVSDLPKVAPSTAAEPLPVVTDLHVEALAVTPLATKAIVDKPARLKATPVVKKAKPRPKSIIPSAAPEAAAPEAIVALPVEMPLSETSPDASTKGMTTVMAPLPEPAMVPEPAVVPEPAIEQLVAAVPEPMVEVPVEVPPKASASEAAPAPTAAVESTALPPIAEPVTDPAPPMDLTLKPIPRRAPPKAKAAPKPPFAE